MLSLCNPFQSHQGYWSEFDLHGIEVKAKKPVEDTLPCCKDIRPYLWGKGIKNRLKEIWKSSRKQKPVLVPSGYAEARSLIGNGTKADLETLSLQAQHLIIDIFAGTTNEFETKNLGKETPLPSETSFGLVTLRLSSDLQLWKEAQHAVGNVLPPKGSGLAPASDLALDFFGATSWPEAMKTNNALFGCGIANLLIGAADEPTMFSNYVTDMAFYYEHGYNYVFPSLETLLQRGLEDRYAMRTRGGRERRDGVYIGKQYIQAKIKLEEQHVEQLSKRSARLARREAQIVSLSESSLLGMAAEAMAQGFDPAAVTSDLVFSSPGTDVVDVGCDLVNSEVMNSFLNVADITDTGVVSEVALRRVYDAYAATGARMLTQRWHEPVARMCALLYTWHIQNDRHMFFRRAILGWPKVRKMTATPPFEADFDEVFDARYHTTGYSRPLEPKYTCNGKETCDHVHDFLDRNADQPLLRDLWWALVVGPLEYVKGGQVNDEREEKLVQASRLRMAELYSRGLVLEMVWLIAHASHHAWQVNYLFEAAMFGSILDGETLAGKLDREQKR
ncbi:hypothetical protein LMH87_005244 [Akanthomyces muscarius]|uniref:Uncharacterized protein n=1 Tax=Akanthomyces muscarius TaxID=2231603 RepID=A0A9W8URS7_AKAMU|nr:hypothetical protein LMH87_005244 [Akanthomyces muscarius]KAJ4163523.1 hypothetical protein LMH87_005244 [Akanthomyces muscarius]